MHDRNVFPGIAPILSLAIALQFVLLIPGLSTPLFGQDYIEGPVSLGISFLGTFPYGDYQEQMSRTGGGLTLEGAYVFKPWPVMAGISGSFSIYDSRSHEVPWYDGYPSGIDVSYTNSLLLGHLFLRFQPQYGFFRPYFEGLFGLTALNAEAWLAGDEYEEDETASASYGSVVLSYGGGGGAAFLLHEDVLSETRAIHIYLDVRIRYIYGGETGYYQGSTAFLNTEGELKHDRSLKKNSRTDLITGSIGIIVRL